ncbi:uncharacterized protein GA0115251_11964, partial [Streptomyces sp. TverLS-915]
AGRSGGSTRSGGSGGPAPVNSAMADALRRAGLTDGGQNGGQGGQGGQRRGGRSGR